MDLGSIYGGYSGLLFLETAPCPPHAVDRLPSLGQASGYLDQNRPLLFTLISIVTKELVLFCPGFVTRFYSVLAF